MNRKEIQSPWLTLKFVAWAVFFAAVFVYFVLHYR